VKLGDIATYLEELGVAIDASEEDEQLFEPIQQGASTKSKEVAILFMQINAPGQIDSLVNLAYALAGTATLGSFVAPKTVVAGFKLAASHPALTLVAMALGVTAQQLNVAWQRSIAAGYCGDLTSSSEARNGCSAVRIVSYEPEAISQFCVNIEGMS